MNTGAPGGLLGGRGENTYQVKKRGGGDIPGGGELCQTFFLLFTLLGKRNVLNSLADLMVSVLGILIHHFMIALLKC